MKWEEEETNSQKLEILSFAANKIVVVGPRNQGLFTYYVGKYAFGKYAFGKTEITLSSKEKKFSES